MAFRITGVRITWVQLYIPNCYKETNLEPFQTSIMEPFPEKFNERKPLTYFAKSSLIDAQQGSK